MGSRVAAPAQPVCVAPAHVCVGGDPLGHLVLPAQLCLAQPCPGWTRGPQENLRGQLYPPTMAWTGCVPVCVSVCVGVAS